jgi:hypothetical protein
MTTVGKQGHRSKRGLQQRWGIKSQKQWRKQTRTIDHHYSKGGKPEDVSPETRSMCQLQSGKAHCQRSLAEARNQPAGPHDGTTRNVPTSDAKEGVSHRKP